MIELNTKKTINVELLQEELKKAGIDVRGISFYDTPTIKTMLWIDTDSEDFSTIDNVISNHNSSELSEHAKKLRAVEEKLESSKRAVDKSKSLEARLEYLEAQFEYFKLFGVIK